MKQGDGARRPISSCPCGCYLVAPSHLIPSRSSSRLIVSSERLAVCHPVSSHQMRDKQARRQGRLGLVSVSSSRSVIRAAGGSSLGSRSVPIVSVVASSSSSPTSKQAAAAGRSRGVGGSFSFKRQGSGGGVMPSHRAAFSPFNRGGNDTGRGGRHALIIPTAVSPSAPRLIPIPISKRKPRQASRRWHGRTASTIVSRRTTEDTQARRERRTTSPRLLYHPTVPRRSHGSHHIPHQHNRPAHPTSTNETEKTRRGDNGTETNTETTGERRENKTKNGGQRERRTDDGRTTERKNARPRKTTSKHETHDDKTNETGR